MPQVGDMPRFRYFVVAGKAKRRMGWSTLPPMERCRRMKVGDGKPATTVTSLTDKARIYWTRPPASLT